MMDISIQDQLYIVSASLAVVAIFLLIFCVILCVNVGRLKADNIERRKRELERSNNVYAYSNPTIQPDEELYHRGYLMHQGQVVPRLKSSGNGGYSNDPIPKPSKPSSEYSHSSRDFIPINDRVATKDASKDFKTILNQNTSMQNNNRDYNERQQASYKPNAANENNFVFVPPKRPSQFNSNIILGPSSGQNQNIDNRQEAVTYFNNRAIDY